MGRRALQKEFKRLEREAAGRRAPAETPKLLGERLVAALKLARHPIRATAMAMAGLALAWGIASGGGLVAVVLGAVAGVAFGELLARSPSRLITVLVGLVGVCGLAWWGAERLTHWRIVPALIGPAATLSVSSVIRFFVLSLAVVGSLRALAARHAALVGLEVAAVGASVAALFASHRDGIIARPLWLSDWAWQHGYDPAEVLLTVGAVSVVVLASLLIAESERRVSLASLLGIALIVILELTLLKVEGLPEPQANSDLGLTESQVGDPPKPTQSGGQGPGGEEQKPEDSKADGPSDGQKQDPKQPQGQGQGPNPEGQPQEDQGGQGGEGQTQDERDPEQQGGQGEQEGQEQQGGQGEQQGQEQQGQEQQEGQQGQQGEQQPEGQEEQQGQQGGQGEQQEQQDSSQQPNLDDAPASEGTAPAPMAVVLLGDDYSPPMQAFYFRQDAWSHFNGSRLVAPRRPDVDRDIVRRFPSRPVDVPALPPNEDGLLTEVHAEVVLLAKHAQPFALESAISLKPEPNPNPARFLRSYSAVSMAPNWVPEQLVGRDAGDPEWTDEQLAFYTRPSEDPRFADLAQELIAELPEARRGDPFVEALAVKLWMDEQLTYSTAERHAGVPDPTADFLFGNRIGYCVHFAHAAVYMWRSLGIPARVGTGYMVTEDQRRGSTLVIRGGDAHAWPELYLDGVGWVILDIAAAENLDPPGTPMPDDLSELLGEMARKESGEEAEEGEAPVQRRNFGRDLGLAFLNFVVLFLVFLYLAKLWRRVAPRFARQRRLPAVSYQAIVDMLLDSGLTRRYGETREAFARRISREVPSLAGLTAMHVAASFGDPARPLGERPEFDPAVWERGVGAVRGELPLSVPRWRRILGTLDPSTVLRAR